MEYYKLGDYVSSEKYYLEAIKEAESQDLKAELSATLNNLGILFKDRKELNKAEEYFLAALKIDPNYINALSNYGNLKSDLNKAEPIEQKSIKFLALHSIFAPRSKTTLIPFLFGHNADKAGLSIFSIIFKFNLAITNKAPVLPAEIAMSDFLFFKLSIVNHMLVFFPLFAAASALSSPFTLFSE